MTGSTGYRAVHVDTVGTLVRHGADCIRQHGATAPTADARRSVREVLAAVRRELADMGPLYPYPGKRWELKELEKELAALQ